jgi:hypothetical protein
MDPEATKILVVQIILDAKCEVAVVVGPRAPPSIVLRSLSHNGAVEKSVIGEIIRCVIRV